MVSTALEFNSCFSCDIQQVIHHRFQQRYTFFASYRFSFPFRVAGDQRAGGAGGGFGIAEYFNPVVDLFFEFVFVDEAVDLRGAEEVADAFADSVGWLPVAWFSSRACGQNSDCVVFARGLRGG